MKLRLRELRRELGASQAVIAEGADMSIAQVSRGERALLEDYRMLSDDERAVITNTANVFAQRDG